MTERLDSREFLFLIENIFLNVRDISFDPTNAGFKPQNLEEAINFISYKRVGSCSMKHYLLGHLLQNYGIEVKYLTYPFYW